MLVLNFDYWRIENRQAEIWMPLALQIRQEVPLDSRIVSVTSHDPTLLNLARRQGWLTNANALSQEKFNQWASLGATHLAGSLNWKELYVPIKDEALRFYRLKDMILKIKKPIAVSYQSNILV